MQVRQRRIQPDLRLTAHAVAGRYRLDDLLGRGGAADVYEALDLRLRRPVAVKVFRDGDPRTERHFDDEGRLLAQMQHPGLVTLFDSGHDEGRPFLVMELVEGTTLRRRIERSALTPAETCRIGAALASALDHVHARGVVHRDVKPSNILLDRTDAPRLTDFGISRRFDTSGGPATAGSEEKADGGSDTGTLMGTASYMAPEQVLGRSTGPHADVYSLGLVLIEALKGELEYGGTPLEAALARLHRPPVLPDGLPPDLGELLTAMTAREETGRPDARTCYRELSTMPVPEPPAAFFPPAAPGVPHPHRRATPPSPHRPAGLLARGAALAALGITLTGSLGAAPAVNGGTASPPAHHVTTDHVPDRPTGR